MVAIRHERPSDIAAREVLLDQCFGAARFAKASERLREGRLPAEGLSFVATDRGRLAGTVRLWHVSAGIGRPALLLGPLAVRPDCRGCGIGAALMARAIAEARARGHKEILLVGDEPYYARFGFSAAATGALSLPGPLERHRLLSLSLAGERDEAAGLVRATGARAPRLAEASGDVPVRRRRVRLSHAA
jgi:predicted N-acetyltransferase YhbS